MEHIQVEITDKQRANLKTLAEQKPADATTSRR